MKYRFLKGLGSGEGIFVYLRNNKNGGFGNYIGTWYQHPKNPYIRSPEEWIDFVENGGLEELAKYLLAGVDDE